MYFWLFSNLSVVWVCMLILKG